MSVEQAEQLVKALLFEGYALYPYRASSLKNRQRWPLSALYPPEFCTRGEGDTARMRTECLVCGETAAVHASVRFLQLLSRPTGETGGSDAIEQRLESESLSLAQLAAQPQALEREYATEDRAVLRVRAEFSSIRLASNLYRLRVAIDNLSELPAAADRPEAQLRALVSAHTLLRCQDGEFVSLVEPPAEHAAAAAGCENVGTWPVLVGEARNDVMLSSPVILYDRPKIAPESPGDYFDGTEIDEMLALRVLTLSEAERAEISRGDPRVRRLLERTESLGPADFARLHGAERAPELSARGYICGERVRLRPRKGGDVLDLALAGQAATIVGVEEDFEGRTHYMVTVDADPGRDLGLSGQPGHRFFFHADELERSGP